MGFQTVRLDDETEKVLTQVTKKTWLAHVHIAHARGLGITGRDEPSSSAPSVRNLPLP